MRTRTLETKHDYARLRGMLNMYKKMLSMANGVSQETWSTVEDQELIFEGLKRSIDILEEKMADMKYETEFITKYLIYKRSSRPCRSE